MTFTENNIDWDFYEIALSHRSICSAKRVWTSWKSQRRPHANGTLHEKGEENRWLKNLPSHFFHRIQRIFHKEQRIFGDSRAPPRKKNLWKKVHCGVKKELYKKGEIAILRSIFCHKFNSILEGEETVEEIKNLSFLATVLVSCLVILLFHESLFWAVTFLGRLAKLT